VVRHSRYTPSRRAVQRYAGGGSQEVSTALNVVRQGLIIDDPWSCPVKIGMPLRTQVYGPITHGQAAAITTLIANKAGLKVAEEEPHLPNGIICLRIYGYMKEFFLKDFKSLGARVN